MPKQYEPDKYAFINEEASLTEQEHIPSCDINIMIKNAQRGLDVRGAPIGQWNDSGLDDTTMTGLDYRIQKQRLEAELTEAAQKEEIPEDLAHHIPDSIKQKFGFKIKKKVPKTNDDPNDDQKNAPTVHSKLPETPKPTSGSTLPEV